ncbi:MAG: tetratricopeptide repeat protein [Sphingobacteriaceae bacterium]|nr:tetratricopeptide repeat protein [Sphingobacteriaceae bacterium]
MRLSKRNIFIFLAVLAYQSFFSQEKDFTLKKCETFLQKSEELIYSNLDSVYFYANEAFRISSEVLAKDKTNLLFKRINGNALTNISYYYFQTSELNKAKQNALKAFTILLEVKDYAGLSSCCSNLAAFFENEGKIDQSEYYFVKSLHFAQIAGDSLGIADSYNSLAYLYTNVGNVVKSIEYFQKALDIQKVIGDSVGVANSLFNLGSVYINQGEMKNGIELVKQATSEFVLLGDKQAEANGYFMLSTAYKSKNDMGAYLDYLNKTLQITEEINDQKLKSECLASLSIYNLNKKNFDEAEVLAERAIECANKAGYRKTLSLAFDNLASVYYLRDKNYHLAEVTALKAYGIATEIGYLQIMLNTSKSLSSIYSKLSNDRKALEFFRIYHALNDSVKNDETKQAAMRSRFKFEYDGREQKIRDKNEFEKNLIRTKAESDKNRQQIIIYSVSIVLLLVVVLAVLIFKSLQSNKRKNSVIELQKRNLEHKQQEIIDSINYAKRIQSAILAKEEEIKEYFRNSFLLYRPKDIVAGDFYFFETTSTHVFYAAADCTGHGVPGALVSVVCSNALSRCVKEFELTDPGKILDKTRELVMETFKKSGEEIKDGMDISFLAKDVVNKTYAWSGANNPLWYIQNNAICEVKADKQPIGSVENAKPFTTHKLEISEGDTVFLFTDGYADQFGGPKSKKFMYKQLKTILLSARNESMSHQLDNLNLKLNNWMGENEQVDDICIIGIKL